MVFWAMQGGILGYVLTVCTNICTSTVGVVIIAASKCTIDSVPQSSSAINSLSLGAVSVVFVSVAAVGRAASCVSGLQQESSFWISLFSYWGSAYMFYQTKLHDNHQHILYANINPLLSILKNVTPQSK